MIVTADTADGLVTVDTVAGTYTVTLEGAASDPTPVPPEWQDWVAALVRAVQDRQIRAAIAAGIADLETLRTQATPLIADAEALRDLVAVAPPAYSQAAFQQMISAMRQTNGRQAAILHALSGEILGDLIGLARIVERGL